MSVRDETRYASHFYVYRDASHIWGSFSNNSSKINIQFLNGTHCNFGFGSLLKGKVNYCFPENVFCEPCHKGNKSSSYSTEVAAKMLVTLLDEKISYLTYLTKRNIEVTKTERS